MNTDKLLERSEIDDGYKWRVQDIYADDNLWEKDFEKVKNAIDLLASFKGKISESGESLLEFLKKTDEVSQLLEKMIVYAIMRRDEDTRESFYQKMYDRCGSLFTDINAALAFFEPELLAMDKEKIDAFFENTEGLSLYRFKIDEIMRKKPHILSEAEERIMALSGDAIDTADNVFSMFNNADLKFPEVKDEDGNMKELTQARYISFLMSENREVRRGAFKALYETYGKWRNTLASCLSGQVKSNRYVARARNYDSCIEMYLDNDFVKTDVYNNLIETVESNLDKYQEYMELKRKAMGLDEIHMYDIYAPIVKVPQKKYTFEEGKKIVLEALKPLGEDYLKLVKKSFDEGWIDVYENVGKRSGAYSISCYGVHPYVLLNWQGTLNDVFTLAHELGHAMHSYLSNKNQPFVYARYKIFVAEVASTVNENLLIDYLMNNTDDENIKAYLVNHYLEEFRGTVYRQVMFAHFERDMHALYESGQALTQETLCKLYYDLNLKYFSPAVVVDKDIEMEWARIPHFYSSFYVYKYSTGFSAAVAFAKNILSGDKTLADKYLNLLKSGGNNYPIEQLKLAGVDLSKPDPIEDALNVFGENVKKLSALIV
jgi:oligoendopeptidase F